MKRRIVFGSLVAVALSLFALSMSSRLVTGAEKSSMPFGEKEDVEFANMLWKAMKGYEKWLMKSDVLPGKSPHHGKFIRLYYNMVNVGGKPYHIIVKDNFGGEGATLETVSKSPTKYLGAITPMLQREAGYDPDNDNWFWVKYNPDGTVDKTENGMMLAGRVAKGMDMGCIACHKAAKGNDYIFTNDVGM